jgi:hypothetical protein
MFNLSAASRPAKFVPTSVGAVLSSLPPSSSLIGAHIHTQRFWLALTMHRCTLYILYK